MLAKLFWLAAFASLILAWIAAGEGIVFGYDAAHWFWDALVLGVLALGLKASKYHDCWHLKNQ